MKVIRNNFFVHYIFTENSLPKQGWKIHISVTFRNFLKIRKIVRDFCFKENITFKVMQKNFFLESISKNFDIKLSGKYITIYPENRHKTKYYLRSLYLFLKNEKGL